VVSLNRTTAEKMSVCSRIVYECVVYFSGKQSVEIIVLINPLMGVKITHCLESLHSLL